MRIDFLLGPFRWLGRSVMDTSAQIGQWGGLGVQTLRGLQRVDIWGRLLLGQMAKIGVDSIPIGLFISAFTGVVMALQASYTFTGSVPLYFVGALVGKTMIVELGPVLTGLALSGRVGANIAAELGTMRVTEQIDALETLAYDPVAYLVVPRVLAGVLKVPIVVIHYTINGVSAGWITSVYLLDMSTPEFMKGLRLFFEPWDVQFAVIKSLSFGLTITSIGCFFGFTTRGGAEGVGLSTTRAVVVSSMVILVLDAFWAATLL